MAGEKGGRVITLPDDDSVVTPRTQDQRGLTGRGTDAKKLEGDVEKALKSARESQVETDDTTQDDDAGDSPAMQKIKADLAEERRLRLAAEQRATESAGREADALNAKQQADLNVLETAKTDLTNRQEQLQQQLARAHEEGDFNTIAEVTRKMTEASVQITNIEGGIIALKAQPKQQRALAARGEPDAGRFAQITKDMDPEAVAWFRSNPEYWRDDIKLNKVFRAHMRVMNAEEAPEVNSREYFAMVERELKDPKFDGSARTVRSGEDDDGGDGGRGGDDDGDDARSEAAGGQRRDSRPAAAPVTRNTRTNGGGGRQVRITDAEIEAAELSGLTPEEYMRNKQQLEREDRVGRNARNRNNGSGSVH